MRACEQMRAWGRRGRERNQWALGRSAAAAALGAALVGAEGQALAAAVEDAKVHALVAQEVEVLCEARVVQHVVRVAADREDLARLHLVVPGQG